jgi:hypothetical protein
MLLHKRIPTFGERTSDTARFQNFGGQPENTPALSLRL